MSSYRESTRRRLSIGLYLLIVTLVAGCSDSKPVQPVESITPQLDAANKVTEMIGPAGGSVIMNDSNGLLYTLDIAPGVLPEDMEISMTPVVDIPDAHFQKKFHIGVQFEPEGLYMTNPAILTIDLPVDANIARLVAYSWRGIGEAVYLEPYTETGSKFVYPVAHFSGTGTSEGDVGDAAGSIVADGSLEAQFKKELTIKADEIAQELCGGDAACMVEQSYTQKFSERYIPEILPILSQWLDTIDTAIDRSADPRAALKLFHEYFAWYATAFAKLCGVDSGGCALFSDNFDVKTDILRTAIAEVLVAEFQKEFDECDDIDLYQLLYTDVFFAVDRGDVGLTHQFADSLAVAAEQDAVINEIKNQFGCHLVIDVINFPESLTPDEYGADLEVQLSNKADVLDIPLAGVDVKFKIAGSGCGRIDGTTNEPQTRVTDATGRVIGVTIDANNCLDGSTLELHVSVDDQVAVAEADQFFIGKTVMLEADVIDCGAPAPKTNGLRFKAGAPDVCAVQEILIAATHLVSPGEISTDIFSLNADGSNPLQLTHDGASNFPITSQDPTWSPDRTKIAFYDNRTMANEIYVMDADGTNEVQLTDIDGMVAVQHWNPAWSPDGLKIAYRRFENFYCVADIYVMNADGTDKQQMTFDGEPKHELSWSPDGTQIAYSQDEPGGGSEIIVADVVVAGSTWTLENPVRVTSNGLNNRHAAWSPDGSKIAFTKYETSSGDRDIYVIGADGLNEQQLTGPDAPFQEPGFGDIQVDDNYPSWSPDGTQIAFSRVTQAEPPIVGDGPPGYATEVFTMNADGSNLQRKTVNNMQEYQVSWSNW